MPQLGTILSIEDNDTDFMTLEFALRSAGVKNPVERWDDGSAAMRAVLEGGKNSPPLLASLILLDLNLPGVDGLQFLKALRARDPERSIPVLVLSTSSHPRDIEACHLAGADAYLVKPFELEDWEARVGSVAERWLSSRRSRPGHNAKPATSRNKFSKATATMKAKYERDMRRAQLTRAIEGEVIPRLLLALGAAEASPLPRVAELSKIAREGDEVAELAHLVLKRDIGIAASYVKKMRMQGATLENVFQALIVPAARLIGDLWKADLCSFSEFSDALSRLQNILAELNPSSDSGTIH